MGRSSPPSRTHHGQQAPLAAAPLDDAQGDPSRGVLRGDRPPVVLDPLTRIEIGVERRLTHHEALTKRRHPASLPRRVSQSWACGRERGRAERGWRAGTGSARAPSSGAGANEPRRARTACGGGDEQPGPRPRPQRAWITSSRAPSPRDAHRPRPRAERDRGRCGAAVPRPRWAPPRS